jgi:hypothetical protein
MRQLHPQLIRGNSHDNYMRGDEKRFYFSPFLRKHPVGFNAPAIAAMDSG